MEQKPKEGDREFTGRGMATIFGAPISWIALFGALMGALSIVPMIFYPFGGGFASAGMLVFGPLAGLILGPWAGAVAGLIGGLIGMFISPGSYPLGLIDVMLSGMLLPIFWGLAKPYYRKIYIPFVILWIIYYFLTPFYFPGEAGGFRRGPAAHVHPVLYLGTSWIDLRHPDAENPAEMDEVNQDRQAAGGLYPLHGRTMHSLAAAMDRRLLLGAQVSTANG